MGMFSTKEELERQKREETIKREIKYIASLPSGSYIYREWSNFRDVATYANKYKLEIFQVLPKEPTFQGPPYIPVYYKKNR